MRYKVIGPVAILQEDAIIGLSGYQAFNKRFHVEPVEGGGFRVKAKNVKFGYRETVDVIDGYIDPKSPALEPIGKAEPMLGPTDDMKAEADRMGIRFGLGIGAKTLGAWIASAKAGATKINATEASAKAETKAAAKLARAEAAKARKGNRNGR